MLSLFQCMIHLVLIKIFYFTHECFAHMCACVLYMYGVCEVCKGTLCPLEWELLMIVSSHEGARN